MATTLERRRRRAEVHWAALTASPRPVIYLGMGSCGRAAGAVAVYDAVRAYLDDHRIDGDIVSVGCIGPCYLEPLLDVQMPGRPRVSYSNMTAELVGRTLDGLLRRRRAAPASGRAASTPPTAIWDSVAVTGVSRSGRADHPPPTRRLAATRLPTCLPATRSRATSSPATRLPTCLASPTIPCSRSRYASCCATAASSIPSRSTITWRAAATAPSSAASTMPWREVDRHSQGSRGCAAVAAPGFRRRSSGWCAARATAGPRNLICNADEGDPGAFMNRSLIEGDPHAVLEGMLIAAYAIGAQHGYVYIRAEYPLAIARLRTAIAAARKLGLLGDHILGSELLVRRHAQGGSRGLRLRRGDRTDREHRGPSRHAAHAGRRSRPSRASGAGPRSSTTSRRWPRCRPSSATAPTGMPPTAPRPRRAPRRSPSWARCDAPG